MARYSPLLSVKNTREIRDLALNGRRYTFEGLTLYFKPNIHPASRVAIAVRKKTGKAVVRNLIKRRLKDVLRMNQYFFIQPFDMLIVVNPNPNIYSYSSLQNSIINILQKSAMIKRTQSEEE